MKDNSLDGLRGLAALNVAISHFVCAFLPSMLYKNYPTIFTADNNQSTLFYIITSPLISLIYNGHFPVLIFFVLSGYVLTLPYFQEDSNTSTLKKRLWGRYIRLNIPIASAILISFLFYKLGLYHNIQAAKISGSLNWLSTFYPGGLKFSQFISEALYSSILFGNAIFIPPLWTLRIEFIGSIYLLIFYLIKPQHHNLIPSLTAFALLYLTHKSEAIYFYAILAGSFLNLFHSNKKLNPLLLVIGLYFGSFQFNSQPHDILPFISIFDQKTFYNTLGAILTVYAIKNGFGSTFFQTRPLIFLGKISFSFYLIHFIILCSISSYLYTKFSNNPLHLISLFTIYIAICIITSKIFELIIDNPSINISHKFTKFLFQQNNKT